MSGEELSRALSDISDDKIEAAMEIRPVHRNWWPRVVAAAAVLALILTAALWPAGEEDYVTAPGLLSVHAHSIGENGDASIESVILEDGLVFTPNIRYDPQISYVQHFPISFSIDQAPYKDMEITLEVSTNAGIFYKNEPFDPSHLELTRIEQMLANHYGQHFTVNIDKKVYWEPSGFDYDYLEAYHKRGGTDLSYGLKDFGFSHNPSFIDIIIRANDLIVGYCIIEIRDISSPEDFPVQEFSFEVLTIVSFPKVDGNWQNVTLNYVQEHINNIHIEREDST